MWWTNLLLVKTFLLGHLALWVVVFNRLHATNLPCRVVNFLEKVIFLIILLPPLWLVAGWSILDGLALPIRAWWDELHWLLLYVAVCWMALGYVTSAWLVRRVFAVRPAQFLANDTVAVDVASRLPRRPALSRSARWLSHVPGNQVLQLRVQDKRLVLPRLPAELDGLTIVHLSDFHFAGHLDKSFFQEVIGEALALKGDVIAVTGDLVDKTQYIDWLPDTVGRLRAPLGVYYVLGNHDLRVKDVSALHRVLQDCGLVHLGGRCMQVTLRGQPVVLAGNEAPWFARPVTVPAPSADATAPFRLLLSHSPDQLRWAREHGFDLMLAGHTHGGQIRFPLVGPVVCPSRYGVRYASGVFYEQPTLMHVTRGISGLEPIRLNCPPELARLHLVRG